MKTLYLIRTKSTEQGTFGVAYYNKKLSWLSLELPDLNNLPRVSCIPVGEYIVKWTYSPRFKRHTYEIMNVRGRGGIRIHSGNFAGHYNKYRSHSQGCPLFGVKLGIIKDQLAVLSSKIAVWQFEKTFNKETFLLRISYA